MSSRNVYDLSYEQNGLRFMHQHVLCFTVLEVKMSCICSPEARAIHSRVCKQNNCPCFGTQSTSSRILMEQASFVDSRRLVYKEPRTVDCRLRTVSAD